MLSPEWCRSSERWAQSLVLARCLPQSGLVDNFGTLVRRAKGAPRGLKTQGLLARSGERNGTYRSLSDHCMCY